MHEVVGDIFSFRQVIKWCETKVPTKVLHSLDFIDLVAHEQVPSN